MTRGTQLVGPTGTPIGQLRRATSSSARTSRHSGPSNRSAWRRKIRRALLREIAHFGSTAEARAYSEAAAGT